MKPEAPIFTASIPVRQMLELLIPAAAYTAMATGGVMAEMMYRDALRRALDEEMRRDPLVFLMGETIAERGGSYKVTEGLFAKYGPKRVRDTPISEQAILGGTKPDGTSNIHLISATVVKGG